MASEPEEHLEGFPSAKRLKLEHVNEAATSASGDLISGDLVSGDLVSDDLVSDAGIAKQLLEIESGMCKKLGELNFGSPITHIYNPLDYASHTHSQYVSSYGNTVKKILFVGMNPGPFGMAQNGVAFGDTRMVKEWLEISGEVSKPALEHPNRPIHGLECSRAEVSGTRFWGLFKELCTSPQVFFRNCYVHNYCPLCFMNKSGKNITPPSLKAAEKAHLQSICDHALLEVVQLLGVQWVVGVGKFGADRAKAVLKADCAAFNGKEKHCSCCGRRKSGGVEVFTLHRVEREVCVTSIMHPSPINPAANKGWTQLATSQLSELGILDIITAQ